ncbi:MAG: hypothetical protein PHG35_04095 [Dehalococcoidales bacterium]|nr:hypothetical protein [Dehalococcoidales bacterium]
MSGWLKQLKYDPTPVLLNAPDKAISYLTRRDLLNEKVESLQDAPYLL